MLCHSHFSVTPIIHTHFDLKVAAKDFYGS